MGKDRITIGYVGSDGTAFAYVGAAAPSASVLTELAAALAEPAQQMAVGVRAVADMPTLRFDFLEPPSAGDVLRVLQLLDGALRGGQVVLTGLGVRGMAAGEESPEAPILFATFALAG